MKQLLEQFTVRLKIKLIGTKLIILPIHTHELRAIHILSIQILTTQDNVSRGHNEVADISNLGNQPTTTDIR
jgi:hypothetical protein